MVFELSEFGEHKGHKHTHGGAVAVPFMGLEESHDGAAHYVKLEERHDGAVVFKKRVVRACVWLTAVAAVIFAGSMLLFQIASRELIKKNRALSISSVVGNYWLTYEHVYPVRDEETERNGEEAAWPYALYRLFCTCERNLASAGKKTPANTSSKLLVFFIHGNLGAYDEVSQLGCVVSRMISITSEVYTFDFLQQANIHRGKLLQQQAAFVAHTLGLRRWGSKSKNITSAMEFQGEEMAEPTDNLEKKDDGTGVWIVGHSMGGVVARLAVEMMRNSGTSIFLEGVITLNTPHRYPPIFMDAAMFRIYTNLWQPSDRGLSSEKSWHRAPHLYSLTSGSLDLQVEQWLTNLAGLNEKRFPHTMFRTEDPTVCGKSLSHTDIVRDYCVLEFVANIIAKKITGLRHTPIHARNPLANSSGGVTAPLWWANKSVTSHTLPVAALSFYTALVLSAIYPTVFPPMANQRFISNHRISCFCWGRQVALPRGIPTMGGAVIGSLFIGICSRIFFVQIRCFFLPCSSICGLPWVADDLACISEAGCSHLPSSFVAWLGPALLGSWVGLLVYYLICGLLRLSLLIWTVLGSCHFYKTHLLRHIRPGVNMGYCFFMLVYPVTAVTSTVFLELYQRTIVWLAFILLMMPLRVSLENAAANTPQPTASADASAPVAVYALLHALNVQPTFARKNKKLSGTADSNNILDECIRVSEVLLHVLLFTHFLWPIFRSFVLQKSGYLPLLKLSSSRGSFLCMATSVVFILIYMSLFAMNRLPVEVFRVVWTLLWGFPAFLFVSTVGLDGVLVERFASTSFRVI
ncbi:GPI inositol deacylase 2 [Trypanosoma cruzi]|uniref:GPI inositol-deacylase n=1 Tax=Trypanosoma cruzi TaxID=5693 RepID=A0A7J6YEY6_TRYCR|nr:GPI inositol deacylase 2 [Trypanosoma cruzi]KAF8293262.1 GPI inositol deacylase 2 [Trypanosoma cruzi]